MAPLEGTVASELLTKDVELQVLSVGVFIFSTVHSLLWRGGYYCSASYIVT